MSRSSEIEQPSPSNHPHGARPTAHQARDEALFVAARQGSADALRELLELLARQLWRQTRGRQPRNVGPSTGMSDLVQSTLLRAQERFERFERDTFFDFMRWARRILRNKLLGRVRKHRLRTDHERLARIAEALQARLAQAGWAASSCGEAERREEAERAYRTFQELPVHQRFVIQLRAVDGLKFGEIANMTGSTAEAARMKYRRAMAELRHRLARPG